MLKLAFFKRFKRLSIKHQLIIALFILTIPTFIIGIGSYIYSIDVIEDKIAQTKFGVMDEKSKTISILLENIESRGQQIKDDNDVQKIMSKDYIDGDYEENYRVNQTLQMIEKVSFSNEDIMSIYLVATRFHIKYKMTSVGFMNQENTELYGWYQGIDKDASINTWIRTRPNEYKNYFDEYILTHVSSIHDYNNKVLGHIIININERALNRILYDKQLAQDEKIYLIDENNQIFYTSDRNYKEDNSSLQLLNPDNMKSEKGNFFTGKGKNKYLVVYSTLPKYNWKLIYQVPQSVITSELKNIDIFFFSIFVLCVIIFIVLAFFLYRQIVGPIKDFKVVMDNIGKGNFSVQDYDQDTNNEVVKLYSSINSMTVKVENLIEKNVQMMEQKKEAEMRALQSQINPHFLYNTLDAINWLAVLNQQPEISDMVKNLSRFFRSVISNGKELITIEEELKHVQAYIEIERFRYKNRFKVMYNIDKRLLKHPTLKLIIQPFVENSLNHGFSHREGEGEITIQIFSKDNTIFFEIIDDGKGMTKQQLKGLMEKNTQSYGIRNVDDRIKIQYGNDYGVIINSQVNNGTAVLISMPKE